MSLYSRISRLEFYFRALPHAGRNQRNRKEKMTCSFMPLRAAGCRWAESRRPDWQITTWWQMHHASSFPAQDSWCWFNVVWNKACNDPHKGMALSKHIYVSFHTNSFLLRFQTWFHVSTYNLGHCLRAKLADYLQLVSGWAEAFLWFTAV